MAIKPSPERRRLATAALLFGLMLVAGQATAFERSHYFAPMSGNEELAQGTVNAVLAHADGFLGFTGHGWGVERPQVYLFTIKWTTLEAHVEGFRASPAFAQWRALIGPHFDGAPVVEHFSA